MHTSQWDPASPGSGEVPCGLVSPAGVMALCKGIPIKAGGWDGEGSTEALFHPVPKLVGWGEKSCRQKSNHISDALFLFIHFLGDP